MKEDKFNLVLNKFNQVGHNARIFISNYDLSKILLMDNKKIEAYFKQASKIQSEMDNIISDLYHLIGMGKLSAVQSAKLIKSTKKILNYRHPLKTIISNKNNILIVRSLFVLPDKGKYKIKLDDAKSIVL